MLRLQIHWYFLLQCLVSCWSHSVYFYFFKYCIFTPLEVQYFKYVPSIFFLIMTMFSFTYLNIWSLFLLTVSIFLSVHSIIYIISVCFYSLVFILVICHIFLFMYMSCKFWLDTRHCNFMLLVGGFWFILLSNV